MSEFIITDEESSTDDELHNAKTLRRTNTVLKEMNQPKDMPRGKGGAFREGVQNRFFNQL